MCVIFRRITCRGHVGTLASIYGVGGCSRYIRSDRVEYLVLLCPSTPPRFHLCSSFSQRASTILASPRFSSTQHRATPRLFLLSPPLSSRLCFLSTCPFFYSFSLLFSVLSLIVSHLLDFETSQRVLRPRPQRGGESLDHSFDRDSRISRSSRFAVSQFRDKGKSYKRFSRCNGNGAARRCRGLVVEGERKKISQTSGTLRMTGIIHERT